MARKRNAYIFDIDGTLALMDGRNPYATDKSLLTDKPNKDVIRILNLICDCIDGDVILVSGRNESARKYTQLWLNRKMIIFDHLFMRPNKDFRADDIIKEEIYRENIKPYYKVLGVFDDRDGVVKMWRKLGLTCLQVNYGNF